MPSNQSVFLHLNSLIGQSNSTFLSSNGRQCLTCQKCCANVSKYVLAIYLLQTISSDIRLFVSKNRWPWFCLSPKIDEDDKDISIEFLITSETYTCGHDPCFPQHLGLGCCYLFQFFKSRVIHRTMSFGPVISIYG